MNDFELRLSRALRDEAEEISMSTDTSHGPARLAERLDHVDRRRRTRRTTWALAATVLLLAGVAVLVGVSRRAEAPPIAPTPTPTPTPSASPFTASSFAVPLTMTPPPWTAPGTTRTDLISPRHLTWDQSVCVAGTDCTWGNDFKLRVVAPVTYYPGGEPSRRLPFPDYSSFLQSLTELTAAGVSITDRSTTTVDGRPATVMTVTSTTNPTGAWGCEQPTQEAATCWGPDTDLVFRFAVIDAPGQPLLLWSRARASNPSVQQSLDDFDQMLTTIRFR